MIVYLFFFRRSDLPRETMAGETSALNDFALLFLSILLEGAPFILLGTLLSGIIDAYLPASWLDRFLPKNRPLAIMLSGLLGFVFPVCECAVVPVIRRLLRKGLPLSCAITYMLSAPIINPVVVISTMKAFDSDLGKFAIRKSEELNKYDAAFMTSSRLLLAFILTVGVGLVLMKVRSSRVLKTKVYETLGEAKELEEQAAAHGPVKTDHPRKIRSAMRTTMHDFVDTTLYFLFGVAVTAIFKAYVTEDLIMIFKQSDLISVALFMALAFILSLCSTSDAFIAANFPAIPAAKLAFLIYGPMMDVKLIFLYSSVFKVRFVLLLAVSLFIATGAICLLWVR